MNREIEAAPDVHFENETDADSFIEGEILDVEAAQIAVKPAAKPVGESRTPRHAPPLEKPDNQTSAVVQTAKPQTVSTRAQKIYIFLPLIFLTVALLGGMRFADPSGSFIFLKPPLVCLVFATILLILFSRAHLINLGGWLGEEFSTIDNIAGGAVLLTLFAASVQIFNSLLPERGLPFWTVGFCFFWTLWNNLFADFEVKKLLRSLGAMFGLAFVVKYFVLANLTAPAGGSWWETLANNPTQSAVSWLLDLPAFSSATGYVQFFALALFLIGLYVFPNSAHQNTDSSVLTSEIIS